MLKFPWIKLIKTLKIKVHYLAEILWWIVAVLKDKWYWMLKICKVAIKFNINHKNNYLLNILIKVKNNWLKMEIKKILVEVRNIIKNYLIKCLTKRMLRLSMFLFF
jgi:hypothetical protein